MITLKISALLIFAAGSVAALMSGDLGYDIALAVLAVLS